MGTVHTLRIPESTVAKAVSMGHDDENDGGNGRGDDMLQRIKDLEKDTQQIKTDLAVMRSNYATKRM